MIPAQEIVEMSPAQLRKGYKAYSCSIDLEFAADPVRFKNHPEIQQKKLVYNRETIKEYLEKNGDLCPQTRIELKGELAAFESLQLEQLLFALEVEKQQKLLSEAAKVHADLDSILEEITAYLAKFRESKPEEVKKASETLAKLLRGDFCPEVSLDSISRLATYGLELDYDTYKGYVEKHHLEEEKAKRELEAKQRREEELKREAELKRERERQEQRDRDYVVALAAQERDLEAKRREEEARRKKELEEKQKREAEARRLRELEEKEAKELADAIAASKADALKERQRETAARLVADETERKEGKEDLEATIMDATSTKKTIKTGETYTHEGDLKLSSIPKNATIIVKGGSLVVKGDVGENATIKVQQSEYAGAGSPMMFSSGGSFASVGQGGAFAYGPGAVAIGPGAVAIGGMGSRNASVSGGNVRAVSTGGGRAVAIGSMIGDSLNFGPGGIFGGGAVAIGGGVAIAGGGGSVTDVTIEGNVKRGVQMSSAGAISCRNLAENCKLEAKGDINCKNVGESSILRTSYKNIQAENVAANAQLSTEYAFISVHDVGKTARLITKHGAIHARSVATGALLYTQHGDIQVEGRVFSGAKLETSYNPITAGHVERGATLKTSYAPINVISADDTGLLSTSYAEVFVGGRSISRGGHGGWW